MKQPWTDRSRYTDRDNRRKLRIPAKIAIRVSGIGPDNRYFIEKTETIDVSYGGCSFLIQVPLPSGQVVNIRPLLAGSTAPQGKRALFRISWQKKTECGYRTGAFQLQPYNFWGVEFPSGFTADLTTV